MRDGTFPTLNMTKDGPAPIAKLDPYQWTEEKPMQKEQMLSQKEMAQWE